MFQGVGRILRSQLGGKKKDDNNDNDDDGRPQSSRQDAHVVAETQVDDVVTEHNRDDDVMVRGRRRQHCARVPEDETYDGSNECPGKSDREEGNVIDVDGTSVMVTEDGWIRVAESDVFDVNPAENRVHLKISGRYVSVIKYKERLHCIDSVCFHAGGPLTLGDIEELPDGKACLVCPWHFYHISISDGEKWYQTADPGDDGKLRAGKWKSVGKRQRCHEVKMQSDGLYVRLNTSGSLASDEYASKQDTGERIKSGSLRIRAGMDGSRSPSRSGSPMRVTPPASPRVSFSEGEDVWPDDLDASSYLSVRRARRESFDE